MRIGPWQIKLASAEVGFSGLFDVNECDGNLGNGSSLSTQGLMGPLKQVRPKN